MNTMETIERERERKFDVTDDVEIPDLDGVSVVDGSNVTLTATYWDTPDRRLLRWGHTLRHRRASDGSEDGWTLKLAVPSKSSKGDVDREEVSVPGSPGYPPARLRSLVGGVVRKERLGRIATITTDRRRVELAGQGSEDRAAVEVSDDRVSSTVDRAPGAAFRQIEVEAKAPAADPLLDAMSESLTKAGARPTTSSKLAMVLDGPVEPEIVVPDARPKMSIEDLARVAVGSGTMKLIENDPAARLGSDPEPIHQARVATRRLRSDLKTLEPLLSATRVEWLREELAWVGGLFGAVRDLDVLIERMDELAGRFPEERDTAPALVEALREDRRVRHVELVDALGSPRYRHLLDELVAASSSPPLAAGVDGQRRVRSPLRKLARKTWRRLARAVKRLDVDPSHEDLHEIRKRAKRARYAAELSAGVLGKGADRLAGRLEDLQDVLGELQDAVVAEQRLRSMARDRLGSGAAFTAGTLACAERDARSEARDGWQAVWRSARAKRLRRWLR
jgi:CHAD domain-containing protein